MQINSVNNVGFGAKKPAKTKEEKQQAQKRYYEYLSKLDANKALIMSKGREEEDGKFKAISTLSGIGAVVSSIVAGVEFSKVVDASSKNINPITGVIGIADKAGKKFAKDTKGAKIAAIATAALAAVSIGAKFINNKRAQKTARERGFYTKKQFLYATDTVEEKFQMVEKAYNNAVK